MDSAPTSNSYRLVAQIEPGDKHQAAYKGDGSNWVQTRLSYTAHRPTLHITWGDPVATAK